MTRESYAKAYEDGRPRTVRFLLSRGVVRDLASDLAQAAWLKGWERLAQLRDERMIVTWVNTIALNFYRRSLRTERRYEPLNDTAGSTNGINWAAIDLSRILGACRRSERALLEAQLSGQTAKEIANEKGVSQTAIRIRLLRARRAARQAAETLAFQAQEKCRAASA